MVRHISQIVFVLMVSLALFGCARNAPVEDALRLDQVFEGSLENTRLADGVPLTVGLMVRWRIDDPPAFRKRFASGEAYGEKVLKPRCLEAAAHVANTYPSVDRVFTSDREKFIQDLRSALQQRAGEPGVSIQEVVVSQLVFPDSFTEAMEQVALKERELEAIKQRNAVDIEAAKAAERKAEADGLVTVRRAEVEGKVAEINAKTEDKRRLSELARAETQAQIAEKQAHSEALRQKVLAEAEADRQRKLSEVRIEEQKQMRALDVDKQHQLDLVALEKEKAVAELCAANPAYAQFLINRELASKVQIAVVPLGSESGFLNSLIQNQMSTGSPQKR